MSGTGFITDDAQTLVNGGKWSRQRLAAILKGKHKEQALTSFTLLAYELVDLENLYQMLGQFALAEGVRVELYICSDTSQQLEDYYVDAVGKGRSHILRMTVFTNSFIYGQDESEIPNKVILKRILPFVAWTPDLECCIHPTPQMLAYNVEPDDAKLYDILVLDFFRGKLSIHPDRAAEISFDTIVVPYLDPDGTLNTFERKLTTRFTSDA